MQQPVRRDEGQLMQPSAHTTQAIPCIQRYWATGSMKKSVRQMHLDNRCYHKHAGLIVTERKLRRDA